MNLELNERNLGCLKEINELEQNGMLIILGQVKHNVQREYYN